ncbi:NAD(P)/FAD-dependent oxidoreductase [Streptomyces sp. VRA16 Mangrove soil]|uniref:NAD(P)/FAD-dependent oxidoreductase n=1 Tax=Streptomyces sp. VRA16 Mangrove soil TaxID=2817434 RepID=UPI001A9E45B6|nr:FAD-dependent oxidoreductase [Streptomyces sp. VRA16 Mangrove soil]MBO1336889.1 NAD(P)/FAD-dependent oxidoreductase [Streptomyces sp. VRA16 Mangrove soil]
MTASHEHDDSLRDGARVVVIGTGLAGTRLAQRLGERAVLIGEEAHAPYNRVLLAEVLAGTYSPDVIALPRTPGPRLRTRAVRIDRERRVVQCESGAEVGYDTLVLATGSNPVLPPLRGLFAPGARELPGGVHAFRTMDDCLALSRAVGEGTRAVVIGGGLLGVCAARALARRGVQVVLTQQAERLMERQLDPRSSELVERHLTALGVEIHTECRVRGVGVVDGRVRRVELHDGYVLGTDVTVLACGVRPRTGLAQAAGLDVRKGVVVDDELRTSDPHIRAIGDCAQHDGTVYGLATPALEQADALAGLLTEGAAAYTGTRTLTRLTLPHEAGPLDLAAFGETEALPGDDVVQLTDATRGTYRKVVVRGDRLVGGVLVGELASVGALARAWESDETLPADDGDDAVGASLLHLLTHDGGL